MITCDCRHLQLESTAACHSELIRQRRRHSSSKQTQAATALWVTTTRMMKRKQKTRHAPLLLRLILCHHLGRISTVGHSQPGRSRRTPPCQNSGELRSSSHQLPSESCEWSLGAFRTAADPLLQLRGIQPVREETPLAQVAGLTNLGRREPINGGGISAFMGRGSSKQIGGSNRKIPRPPGSSPESLAVAVNVISTPNVKAGYDVSKTVERVSGSLIIQPPLIIYFSAGFTWMQRKGA